MLACTLVWLIQWQKAVESVGNSVGYSSEEGHLADMCLYLRWCK